MRMVNVYNMVHMVKTERITPLLRSWTLFSVVVFNLFIFGFLLFKRDLGANVIFFEVASLVPILLLNKNKYVLFYIKILLAVALATSTWIRADFLTINLSFVAVVFLNVVLFQEAVTGKLVSISFFLNLPFLFFDKVSIYSGKAVRFLSRWQVYVHKSKMSNVKTDTLKKVLLGLIISFPILVVLIFLFATADQNFQAVFSNFFNGLQNIFDFHWLYKLNFIFDRTWQFGLFWIYLCFTLPVSESSNADTILPEKRVIEKLTVVTLVSAVFALFIVTQAKSINYILNGFTTGQLNPGAFVREGFIQLMIACVVV